MSDQVVKLGSSTVYEDPYLRVSDKRYEYKGEDYRYLIKEEPDFVVCGAVTKGGDVIMVRQFRPGPEKFLYDLPGGMIDEGDTPEETAHKELLEETGYEAGSLTQLAAGYKCAYSTARKYIFLATDCVKVGEPHDEPNMIFDPVLMKASAFAELIKSPDLLDMDAMHLLARYLGCS